MAIKQLGSVNALPPTLTAQWHFNPDQTFDPYVGAGINYTIMLDRNLKVARGALAGSKIKIDSDSWGYALQAGFDINLKDGWLINADVKYIIMDTDVKLKNPVAGNAGEKLIHLILTHGYSVSVLVKNSKHCFLSSGHNPSALFASVIPWQRLFLT